VAGIDALRQAATRTPQRRLVLGRRLRPKAAALATLTVADRDEGLIAHPQRMGSRLRQGITEQAAAQILFDDDPQYEKGIALKCRGAWEEGD
jgi:CelD/BcsL family acetyltransferase involved in cellulose biosynthesis